MQGVITRKGQYYPVLHCFIHGFAFFLLMSDLPKDYLGGEGENRVCS